MLGTKDYVVVVVVVFMWRYANYCSPSLCRFVGLLIGWQFRVYISFLYLSYDMPHVKIRVLHLLNKVAMITE